MTFEKSKEKTNFSFKQLIILGVICHPLNLENLVCADAHLH